MSYVNFDYDHERNTDVNRELSGNSGNENYNVSGAKKRFSAVGFGYMILCVVSLLAANIAALVSAYFFPELSKETWFMLAVSTLPIYAFGLPALWLVIRKEKAEPPKRASFGVGKFFVILIICFGFGYIGSYIGNFLMLLLSEITGYDYSNNLLSVIDGTNLWVVFLFTVIIAPIGEEILFRKLLIDRTKKYGGAISVFVSGLFFGLMHGNLFQFFYAFALGAILAYVYYSTGKIWITVVLHSVINFVGSILPGLLFNGMDIEAVGSDAEQMLSYFSEHPAQMLGFIFFGFFVLFTIVAAPVLLAVFRKKIVFEKEDCQLPKGKALRVAFGNAGMITAVVVYILFMVTARIPLPV